MYRNQRIKTLATLVRGGWLRTFVIWAGLVISAGPAFAQYSLKGWGNGGGCIGDGTTDKRTTPVLVDDGTGTGGKFIVVSAGYNHSLGIKEDGSLWVWGENTFSQLGDGATATRTSPYMLDDGKGPGGKWVAINASAEYSQGIKEDGSLWAWGSNTTGYLGDGTTNGRSTPLKIDDGTGSHGKWVFIEGGGNIFLLYGHAVGIREDGSLWTWGDNSQNQLGDGTTTKALQPKMIDDGTGAAGKWIAATCGMAYTVAIRENGSLWAWGQNLANQLGDGTSTNRNTPTQIDPGTGASGKWIKISAIGAHTLAIREDGSLWAWGYNADGQIGDNTTAQKSVPTMIDAGTAGKWVDVGAGSNFSIGLKEDGSVYTWGGNSTGTIGDGSPSNAQTRTPKHISSLGTVTDAMVAAGSNHILLLAGIPQPCNMPSNLLAAGIYTDSAIISWSTVAGAASYEIAVDQSATLAPSGTATPLTDTFYNATGLAAGQTWYVHVRTSCGGGSFSEWDTLSFATLNCSGVATLSVADITPAGARIYWNTVNVAAGYEIAIDQSATSAPVTTAATLTDTSAAIDSLTSGTRWYAHVRTICGGANSSDWDTISFVTLSCQLPGGLAASNITTNSADIQWNPVAGALGYEIAVDKSATLAPTAAAILQSGTSYGASLPEDGATWYIHLRTKCGSASFSTWDTLSVRTLSVSVGDIDGNYDVPVVYPNPASSFLRIGSDVPVNASVYGMDGKLLLSADDTVQIDVRHLPDGLYILKLSEADGRLLRTLRFTKAAR
jgi:alpha-tubulin suppressor-like RCC1 family protein